MSDLEILNLVIGDVRIIDMSALTFTAWLSGRINGLPTYDADAQTMIQMVANPPMGNTMTHEQKILVIRKLIKLNVPLI